LRQSGDQRHPYAGDNQQDDGAVFSRCAATATAASTANMNSTVAISVMTALASQIRLHDVYGQGEHGELKERRHGASLCGG
jgi:hypothetical protein